HDPAALPNWVRFLTAFDLDYQRRRIRFVISELNGFYTRQDIGEGGLEIKRLDELKARFYDLLGGLRRVESGAFASTELRQLFWTAFSPLEDETARKLIDPAIYYAAHRGNIDRAFTALAAEMG